MSSSATDLQQARAQRVEITDEAISVDLVDARTLIVPLAWFPRLWHGSREERQRCELAADGSYLHWPDLDDDLCVTDLLAGRHSGESASSLRNWLESRRAAKRAS